MLKQLFKKLDAILQLLTEEREDRQAEAKAREQEKEEMARIETEKLFAEYAKANKKRQPTGGIWNGREAQDRPINSGGELIPMNISSTEKQILRDFYDSQ